MNETYNINKESTDQNIISGGFLVNGGYQQNPIYLMPANGSDATAMDTEILAVTEILEDNWLYQVPNQAGAIGLALGNSIVQ